MLREGEAETATWLRMADPVKDWELGALDGGLELVEKADDGKLAHDVDDLSAIFEGLVDGADIALPCDEVLEEKATAATPQDAWIESLDDDVLNVNELSAAFDALVAEQEETVVDLTEEDEDETMEDDDRQVAANVKIVPAAPVWAAMAPLDPRSCIRTPVFKNLDSRIPCISVPRMDLGLSNQAAFTAAKTTGATTRRLVQSMSPKREKTTVAKYHHDPKTCWICKSSKTPEKKRALHRYHEKRTRRNWKRGPRYTGRSHVATSRVRNGGRFICTTRWI